jgi:hypothetical protein
MQWRAMTMSPSLHWCVRVSRWLALVSRPGSWDLLPTATYWPDPGWHGGDRRAALINT